MVAFILRDGSISRGVLALHHMEPLAWWKCYGADVPHLLKMASILLSLSNSYGHAERSFSIQEEIHTVKRNRLNRESVKKHLYCTINLQLIEGLSFETKAAWLQVTNDALDEEDRFMPVV